LIEYYGGDTALTLLNTFDIDRLNKLLSQTREMRRTPQDRREERRAKASKELNDYLKQTDLSSVQVDHVGVDGKHQTLTLEQINNFEF
jgi:hypothetical protein